MLKSSQAKNFFLALLGVSAFIPQAQASDFLDAILDTTPAGYAHSASERDHSFKGFWEDSKTGAEAIIKNGQTLFVIPTYTNHPTWAWDNRHEENGYPFGAGLARQVIDDRGNERMLFLINFIDSNYRPEPAVGYSWLARYPIGNSGLHWGAGYLAMLTARADYFWLPCPLPLPVAKIGTDNVSFYGAYIPFTNVFFFYSAITIDDRQRRDAPLPNTSAWSKTNNLLYVGGGYTRTDNAEEWSTNNVKSNHSWNVGLRHYTGRHWAFDFSYRESDHSMKNPGGNDWQYTFQTYALAAHYNIDVMNNLRLFAGAGFGYSQAKGPQGLSDNSLHPVTQAGFTYAITDHIHLTGNLNVSYARFKDVKPDAPDYVLRTTPTDFSLSLGYAF